MAIITFSNCVEELLILNVKINKKGCEGEVWFESGETSDLFNITTSNLLLTVVFYMCFYRGILYRFLLNLLALKTCKFV